MSRRNALITTLTLTLCTAAGVYAWAYADNLEPVAAPDTADRTTSTAPTSPTAPATPATPATPASSTKANPNTAAAIEPLEPPPTQKPERSQVDLVIALDTSASMNGLIDGTRQKLWDIVDQLARAKPTPILRVGLISYGNSGYPKADGWTRVDQDLTTDLDAIYEKLMALRTGGGTEYVGRTIHVGRTQMAWSQDTEALRILYVAGNESADQDKSFRARTEATLAAQQDIHVNLIYCGKDNRGRAVASTWKSVARAGNGEYASIDHNGGVAVINSPYDARLATLSRKLNGTYLGFGSLGVARKARQETLDESASDLSPMASARRSAAKATPLYDNADWDLVDAKNKGVETRALREKGLPDALSGKTDEEIEVFIANKAADRRVVQEEITTLNEKRRGWLAARRKASGRKDAKAVDRAMLAPLERQAKKKRIAFIAD